VSIGLFPHQWDGNGGKSPQPPHLEENSPVPILSPIWKKTPIPILEPDRNGDRWGFPYPPHPPQIHKCNEIFRMGTLDGLPKSPQNHNVRARNSMDNAIFLKILMQFMVFTPPSD
jgi:hypothetical protein